MTASYIQVPAIELVRQHLCCHEAGTLIDVTVRDLAATIGRSASRISGILKRLQNDGWIDVLASSEGTLIEVLRSDVSDQGADRSPMDKTPTVSTDSASVSGISSVKSDQGADRKVAHMACDQHADPAPCMDDHVLIKNNNNMRARAEKSEELAEQPAPEGIWQRIRLIRPDYSLADATRNFQILIARGKSPEDATGILIWAARTNQPIYTPDECAARAKAAAAKLPEENPYAPARTGQSGRDERRAAGPPERPARSSGRTPKRADTIHPPALTKGALRGLPTVAERRAQREMQQVSG